MTPSVQLHTQALWPLLQAEVLAALGAVSPARDWDVLGRAQRVPLCNVGGSSA